MNGSDHEWDWTIPPRLPWPETPTGRRARGELEHAVDRWCKIWLIDAYEEDCTPSWIAHQVVATEKRPVAIPSIRRILSRWRDAGYADVDDDPLRFVSLTPEGMRLGYEELYQRQGRRRRVSRALDTGEPR